MVTNDNTVLLNGQYVSETYFQAFRESQTIALDDIDGVLYPRIQYGSEYYMSEGDCPQRCRDCGAKQGQFHHINCSVECCAKCGKGQALDCSVCS